MQKCSCTNAYSYPKHGGPVCVICGKDWPTGEFVGPKVERRAKELFHDHKGLTCIDDTYWNKTSPEYREAWILIAEEDLE